HPRADATGTVTSGAPPTPDARAPPAHAASHGSAGTDAVTPAAIGALKNTSDTLNTGAASNIGLIIKGAASQAASLQEWRASSDNVLASVTGTEASTLSLL